MYGHQDGSLHPGSRFSIYAKDAKDAKDANDDEDDEKSETLKYLRVSDLIKKIKPLLGSDNKIIEELEELIKTHTFMFVTQNGYDKDESLLYVDFMTEQQQFNYDISGKSFNVQLQFRN